MLQYLVAIAIIAFVILIIKGITMLAYPQQNEQDDYESLDRKTPVDPFLESRISLTDSIRYDHHGRIVATMEMIEELFIDDPDMSEHTKQTLASVHLILSSIITEINDET